MGLVLMLALIFAFSACSVTNTELPESSLQNTQDDLEHQTNGDVKTLVVYFSAPDNLDNSYVEIDGERLGNTQYMAYVIQENTAADIFLSLIHIYKKRRIIYESQGLTGRNGGTSRSWSGYHIWISRRNGHKHL